MSDNKKKKVSEENMENVAGGSAKSLINAAGKALKFAGEHHVAENAVEKMTSTVEKGLDGLKHDVTKNVASKIDDTLSKL